MTKCNANNHLHHHRNQQFIGTDRLLNCCKNHANSGKMEGKNDYGYLLKADHLKSRSENRK